MRIKPNSDRPALIWIDLTDLAAWTGSATGIQRVVANLAGPLLENDGARGFLYQYQQGRLIEVDDALPIVSRVTLPRGDATTTLRRSRLSAVQATRDRGRAGFRRARRAFHLLPDRWIRLLRRARGYVTRARAASAQVGVPTFRAGDCVLVLGMAWREPPVLESIAAAKQSNGDFRVIVLLYDLIPVLYPHLRGPGVEIPYDRYLSWIGVVADVVISISQATDQDMKGFFRARNVAPPRSVVIRLGDEIASRPAETAPRSDLESGDYILYVSTFEARKNHQLLYMAWKLSVERGIPLPRLVMAGRVGWTTEDVRYLFDTDPDVRESVVVLHDMDDGDLVWLYEHCLFAVYPSVCEGWGLPVAEALRLGKVVIASRASAIQEIAGDLLDYFSPYDPSELLAIIVRYLDPEVRVAKEKQVAASFTPRSWSETIVELRAVIESMSRT